MFSTETKSGIKIGKPEAYQEVFNVLYPRLKGYCKLFISDDDEVEDIIQDSFLALWEKRKSVDSSKNIESLVFVILRNKCLNLLKGKRLQSDNIDFEKLHFSELQHLYQLDLNEKEEEKLEEILMVSIQEAVENMPDKMKEVFVQCKLRARKQKDVATTMGVSIKTVEKHLAKAKVLIEDHVKLKYPSIIAIVMALIN